MLIPDAKATMEKEWKEVISIIWIFEKSCIIVYGLSLREKKENFDNLCFESSQPTVEYDE